MELAGRDPPRPMADVKLGVPGRPKVGDETLLPAAPPPYIVEVGRARRDGERPLGGRGEEERGGGVEPVYFFCVSVRENMACEREDWAFISVSFVRRSEVPCRIRLRRMVTFDFIHRKNAMHLLHHFLRVLHVHFSQPFPDNMSLFVLPNLNHSLRACAVPAQ